MEQNKEATQSVKKCDNCGSIHIRIISWVDRFNRIFFFCSLDCKKDFLSRYEDMVSKEKELEEQNKSVLSEMRSLVGRKTKRGITIMHGKRTFYRRADTEEDRRSGSDVAGETKQE